MQYQRLTEMICPPGLDGLWRGFSDSTVLFKPPEETQELAQFLPRRSYKRGFLPGEWVVKNHSQIGGLWPSMNPTLVGFHPTPPLRGCWMTPSAPRAAGGPLMPHKALRIPCSKPRTCGRSTTAAQVGCCEWTQWMMETTGGETIDEKGYGEGVGRMLM